MSAKSDCAYYKIGGIIPREYGAYCTYEEEHKFLDSDSCEKCENFILFRTKKCIFCNLYFQTIYEKQQVCKTCINKSMER